MNQLDPVLASLQLTVWLVLVEITLVRTGVAGLFCGKWWWFHPILQSRVDRSQPAATINEARFRRRRLEFLLALALGWLPGLVFQSIFRSGHEKLNGTILVLMAAAVAVYIFLSLRRFDREGRERYLARTIAEGQERVDPVP